MKDVTPGKTNNVDYFAKYGKLAMGILAVFVVAGVAYNVYGYLNEKKELAAQSALFKADQSYEKTLSDAQKKVENPTDKKDPKKQQAKVDPVRPSEVDFTASIELYKKVITEHPKSTAAILAAHGISSIYVEKKQYQEALDTLKLVKDTEKKGLVTVMTHLKLSGLYEKVGLCQESINILSTLATDKSSAYLKPEVLLKTGVCYEKLGQFDKAKEAYTQITKDFADTPSSQEAEKYLKLLNLNKG